MGLYTQCAYLTKLTPYENNEKTELLTCSEINNSTHPSFLSFQPHEFDHETYNRIFYISDIHLDHKIVCKFKKTATDDQIKRYVRKIARNLISGDLAESIGSRRQPIIIFGGDISSSFALAKEFYTEFVKEYQKTSWNTEYYLRLHEIYAILGNHEFWDFKTSQNCYTAYKELFESLNVHFLQNKITQLGKYRVPVKQVADDNGALKYEKLKKEDDELLYESQMKNIHNTLIVGGVGFAGYNKKFNANLGLYRDALNRKQELAQTKKWIKTYNKALALAKETDSVLVVLTHNPISDWKPDGTYNTGCVYFTAHSHRNYLYHDDDRNIHVFADNQIGYVNSNVLFKEAYLYNCANPFAHYNDGCYVITIKEYLRFHDYIGEHISGSRMLDSQIQFHNATFYMIKQNGYYGFFLVSAKGTSICTGGRIKRISNRTDIEHFNYNFSNIIDKYIEVLLPYRRAQERISEAIKLFGGHGSIHGCIIDIDFYNHIMLNPIDGNITFYFSPVRGEVHTYKSLLTLLENHNEELAVRYRKLLNTTEQNVVLRNQIVQTSEIYQVDIKNSVYAISMQLNQHQKLFDKKLLRVWNERLLMRESTDDIYTLA